MTKQERIEYPESMRAAETSGGASKYGLSIITGCWKGHKIGRVRFASSPHIRLGELCDRAVAKVAAKAKIAELRLVGQRMQAKQGIGVAKAEKPPMLQSRASPIHQKVKLPKINLQRSWALCYFRDLSTTRRFKMV